MYEAEAREVVHATGRLPAVTQQQTRGHLTVPEAPQVYEKVIFLQQLHSDENLVMIHKTTEWLTHVDHD